MLGDVVTNIKYIGTVVSLIFLSNTLICDGLSCIEVTESFRACSKRAKEDYLRNNLPIFIIKFNLSLLKVKTVGA